MPNCIIIGAGTGVSNTIARRFGKGVADLALMVQA